LDTWFRMARNPALGRGSHKFLEEARDAAREPWTVSKALRTFDWQPPANELVGGVGHMRSKFPPDLLAALSTFFEQADTQHHRIARTLGQLCHKAVEASRSISQTTDDAADHIRQVVDR
jgi:hypothetical protein